MKEKTANLNYSRRANDKMVFPASMCTRLTILLIYSICIICNVAENTTRLALPQMYTIQTIKCQNHFHSMVIKHINPKHKSLGCS